MRILLIGATGYLGATIASTLVGAGHVVLAASRTPPRPAATIHTPLDLDDHASVRAAASGCEAIVLAVGPTPELQGADLVRSTVLRVRHTIAAGRQERVKRLLWIGCASTAGRSTAPATALDEILPTTTNSAFVDALWAAEAEVLAANTHTLFTSALLPSVLLGPNDPRPATRSLVGALMAGLPKILFDTPFNAVDVRDVARTVHTALLQGRPGQRYLLGGRATSLRQIATHLHTHHGAPMPRFLTPPSAAVQHLTLTLDRLGPGRPAAVLQPLHHMPVEIDRTKSRVELGHVSRKLEASLDESVERPLPPPTEMPASRHPFTPTAVPRGSG